MSDRQLGDDWWLASDGKWYPPQSRPAAPAPPPPAAIPAPASQSAYPTDGPAIRRWDWMRIPNFTSRTRRSEFWAAVGIAFAATFVAGMVDGLVFGNDIGIFYIASIALWVWLFWGSSVNRMHDMGQSGWMTLLYFIPFVNFGIFIWVGAGDGQGQSNRWGPPVE